MAKRLPFLFTRLVLLTVMGLSVWGAAAVFGANVELDDKILLGLLLDVPFATALALFVATFTVLDKKGRLLRDSWLYTLAAEAHWIKGGKIKFCPTFWKLGAISGVIHIVVFVVGGGLFGLGYAFINHTAVTFVWTGIAAATILLIFALARIKIQVDNRKGRVGAGGLSSTFVGRTAKASYDKACLTIEVAPWEDK